MPEKPRKKNPVKKKRIPQAGGWKKVEWMCCGFDISLSSIAGAGIAFTSTRKLVPPQTVMRRYEVEEDYFIRMETAARAYNFIHDLQTALKISVEPENVFIAVEEPWAFGTARMGVSQSMKQQAQITGSFMGGLLRYGFQNVHEINNVFWRQLVANDLGITIHKSKWSPNGEGKFRAKQWVLERKNEEGWNIPEFPDLIKRDGRAMPKPEDSRAKPFQSDDRYEALAMMEWMRFEIKKGGKR